MMIKYDAYPWYDMQVVSSQDVWSSSVTLPYGGYGYVVDK